MGAGLDACGGRLGMNKIDIGFFLTILGAGSSGGGEALI